MNNDMEFFFYWHEVCARFMPILEQQKQMWEKAKRTDNIEQIESELRPCILKIDSYEAAKEFLMICKEQERPGEPTALSGLKSLFTELKNIICVVAKETRGVPTDYLEYISKQISPRTYATNNNSRWAKSNISSSGSDNDNQDTVNHESERIVDSQEIANLLPRTAASTSDVKANIDNHNPELKGMIPKM